MPHDDRIRFLCTMSAESIETEDIEEDVEYCNMLENFEKVYIFSHSDENLHDIIHDPRMSHSSIYRSFFFI